jgi:hypothetical protein
MDNSLPTDGRAIRIERTGGNTGHFTVFAVPALLLSSVAEIKHLWGRPMDAVYTLWDTEEAYPIYAYKHESDALAEVVAAVRAHGEDAIATWGLFRATPDGEARETIAIGHALFERAMGKQRSVFAATD